MIFGDNVLAEFGNDSDLLIHHTGSTGCIKNQTGNFYIQNDGIIIIGDQTSSTTGLKFIQGGAIELYHNNNRKLETTATGVTITGTPVISDLTPTRVPFVGGSDQLVDSGNLTFASNVLNVVGRVDATDVDAGSNLRASH